MNFGDILDTWENENNGRKPKKKNPMEDVLDHYLPCDKDFQRKETRCIKSGRDAQIAQQKHLRTLAPQREIDLHGYTVSQATEKLEKFIRECRKDKLRKILIIHGKGNHSDSGPILKKKILQYVQQNPYTGEYNFASKQMGGNGALWVILRE